MEYGSVDSTSWLSDKLAATAGAACGLHKYAYSLSIALCLNP